MSKLRIAVAISGKLRCFKEFTPRFKQYILDPLQPDVFFYGYENKEGQDQNEKDIKELWKPTAYSIGVETPDLIETFRRHHYRPEYDQRKATTTNFDWFMGQYENLKGVASMVRRHERREKFRYDIVIRSRCDYFYYRSPTNEELTQAINGDILIPHIWDFDCVSGIGCSDAWAMANSDNFQHYASLIDCFVNYFNKGAVFHHESMMGWHIRELGLNRIKCLNHMWFEFPEELAHVQEQNRHNY